MTTTLNCLNARNLGKGLTFLSEESIVDLQTKEDEVVVRLSNPVGGSIYNKLNKLGWIPVTPEESSAEDWIFPLT